ncbi:hypothetical protein IW261DRAFT_1416602 [Armillaria novae-zelandiae]|uniref:Uncharacterized protein n=1 Tax=Armillaria novae-zelandiae TaxID=153914 RepID=A0AA39PIG3_9AGAR|nr:hypothetical protein IW261DRAFT_1416602 [Armillaria novae-zelandiae]
MHNIYRIDEGVNGLHHIIYHFRPKTRLSTKVTLPVKTKDQSDNALPYILLCEYLLLVLSNGDSGACLSSISTPAAHSPRPDAFVCVVYQHSLILKLWYCYWYYLQHQCQINEEMG